MGSRSVCWQRLSDNLLKLEHHAGLKKTTRWSVKTRHSKYSFALSNSPEVARVTFSDSDSTHVTKILNLDPVRKFFKFENPTPVQTPATIDPPMVAGVRNFEMYACFHLKEWPRRLLLLHKLKSASRSGSVFSQTFDTGSERKTQNPAAVDSSTPDPWPPLVLTQQSEPNLNDEDYSHKTA